MAICSSVGGNGTSFFDMAALWGGFKGDTGPVRFPWCAWALALTPDTDPRHVRHLPPVQLNI